MRESKDFEYLEYSKKCGEVLGHWEDVHNFLSIINCDGVPCLIGGDGGDGAYFYMNPTMIDELIKALQKAKGKTRISF